MDEQREELRIIRAAVVSAVPADDRQKLEERLGKSNLELTIAQTKLVALKKEKEHLKKEIIGERLSRKSSW